MQSNNLNDRDCTVIILSYNEKNITDTCLEKATTAARYSKKIIGNEIKIVVVDNGSQDGSCEMIMKKYPDIHLISLPENIGCSRANNLAMKEANTPYILLINNDAYLSEDTLEKALNYMTNKQSCDVLCVKQLFKDGTFQSFGGNLPTLWRTIFWTFGIENIIIIKNLIRPIYQYNPSYYEEERQIGWCSTAFFLLRKKVYEKTGGLDENIFFYLEDVEWCKRIKDDNFNICYTPSIVIVHLGSFTTKKLSQSVLLSKHIRGILYFQKIHYPKTFRYISICLFIGMILRGIFFTLTRNKEKAIAYKKILDDIKI